MSIHFYLNKVIDDGPLIDSTKQWCRFIFCFCSSSLLTETQTETL